MLADILYSRVTKALQEHCMTLEMRVARVSTLSERSATGARCASKRQAGLVDVGPRQWLASQCVSS